MYSDSVSDMHRPWRKLVWLSSKLNGWHFSCTIETDGSYEILRSRDNHKYQTLGLYFYSYIALKMEEEPRNKKVGASKAVDQKGKHKVSLSGRGHGEFSRMTHHLYCIGLRDDLPSLNAQGHSTIS
jgi:hypothetical protein